MDWIERAEREIEEEFERGDVTEKEYNAAMRDLYQEVRDCAEDAAQEAYDNSMRGDW